MQYSIIPYNYACSPVLLVDDHESEDWIDTGD